MSLQINPQPLRVVPDAHRKNAHKRPDMRCEGPNRDGTRCLRDGSDLYGGDWLCWQHGKQASAASGNRATGEDA